MSWQVAHGRGDAARFHGAELPAVRTAAFHAVERPTLVLGSSQRTTDADARVAAALGIEVVVRRSGGGAVLLMPDEQVWLDLVIPVDDPLWADDVGRAMVWVGEMWRDALADLGVAATVHSGAMRSTTWSRQVCFSGVGTGEVLDAHGGKLVGVAQRRTRGGARFQTMCHLRWRPELVAALVAPPRPTAAELARAATCVPASPDALISALVRHLPT